jgi:hypothetical protein
MDDTKRVDVGYTYWCVNDRHNVTSLPSVLSYIQSHGYSPGDGTTFVILSPYLSYMNRGEEWIIIGYGDEKDIAFSHTMEKGGKIYTLIDYGLNILDMTKYTISPSGEVMLDGYPLGITSEQAAYARGVQYNHGSPITTFRQLTSYIISHYDMNHISLVILSTSSKYSVRSTREEYPRLEELKGIILYDRSMK